MGDGREAWTVLGPNLCEVAPAAEFLRYLHRIERSPNTLRAYALDLKLFFRFLAARSLAWIASAFQSSATSRVGFAGRRTT